MSKTIQAIKRQKRTRKKIFGTEARLRLSVFRSNRSLYAQIINDEMRQTIVGVSEREIVAGGKKATKVEKARALGMLLAKKAIEKKIKTVVFDRGSYMYHGRVKALAEGMREGGLQF